MRLTAILCIAALPAHAADMRDCRLDALSFIDPWSEGRFDVIRVGENRYYDCGTDAVSLVPADTKTDVTNCRGPYGHLALEGTLQEYGGDAKQQVVAVYSVIDGLPCCGWTMDAQGENPDIMKDIKWFEPGAAPILGTQPFASIDNAEGGLGSTNPLLALVCAHPLP